MNTFIIYNAKHCSCNGIGRITGYIDIAEFATLMRYADNKVNPRSAKNNRIISAVHTTLNVDPELLWLKSKGILVSTTELQVSSIDNEGAIISMSLDDPTTEGIMDGGHTMLALATFLLEKFVPELRIKYEWTVVKDAWTRHYDTIRQKIEAELKDKDSQLSTTSIPIDIICPATKEDKPYFLSTATTICGARNLNVQLSEVSKLHHRGMYDLLRDMIPNPDLFQWKEGEDSGINLKDLTCLADIPLNWLVQNKLIPTPHTKFTDMQHYNSKGASTRFYEEILTNPEISDVVDGKVCIKNPLVISALRCVKDLMAAHDKLYLMFPAMYNANTGYGCRGIFGSLECQKMRERKVKYGTTNKVSKYSYAEGFVLPLVVACSELLRLKANKKELTWIKKPYMLSLDDLIKDDRHAPLMAGLKDSNFDSTAYCKKATSYMAARSIFKKIAADCTTAKNS